MEIRGAVATDVDDIMATHLSAISEICSRAYEPDEISAWIAGGAHPDRYLPGIDRGRFIVAVLEGAATIIDSDGRPTRAGYRVDSDGTKARVARRSGGEL